MNKGVTILDIRLSRSEQTCLEALELNQTLCMITDVGSDKHIAASTELRNFKLEVFKNKVVPVLRKNETNFVLKVMPDSLDAFITVCEDLRIIFTPLKSSSNKYFRFFVKM